MVKRLILSIALALGMIASVGVVYTSSASASGGYTDLCIVANTQACLRYDGGPIDIWGRDISGDPNQHFAFVWQGVNATKANCPYAYSPSFPIYKIETNNGLFAVADSYTYPIWYVDSSSNSGSYYTNWAYSSSLGGLWVNCFDNTGNGGNWYQGAALRSGSAYYTQVFTQQAARNTYWVIIDPPRK